MTPKHLIWGIIAITSGVFASQSLLSESKKPLSNFQGSITCTSTTVFEPKSYQEAAEIVQEANLANRTVMVGAPRFASQLDAACADEDGVQVTLKHLNRMITVDTENKTATVQAGMRFAEFSEAISKFGLAVNMVTELNSFTIGGMLGSGTHGSTYQKKGAMISDYVTSMKIIDGQGEVRTLTGDLLDAARVNLGVLGIVVEVTIQLEDAFKVKAVQNAYASDKGLEDKILSYPRNNYSASVAWFPGIGKYTTTIYEEVPFTSEGNAYNSQAARSDTLFKSYSILTKLGQKSQHISCLAAEFRYQTRKAPFFAEAGKVIKSGAVGYSHRMQYFGCDTRPKDGRACLWDNTPIKLEEIGIPMERLPEAIADIRRIVAKKKTCFNLNGIYFRFAKASASYLGMPAGRDTAFVSIEFVLNKKGTAAPINYDVLQEIEQMLLHRYEGRPHWGKNSIPVFLKAANKFPKWDNFLAAKKELDPNNTFSNKFWQRIISEKITSEMERQIYSEGCVDKDTCYCQKDLHCPNGKTCQSGLVYTEAKVCR